MANGKAEYEISGLEGAPPVNGVGRRIIGYPLVLPPVLPDGRVPIYREIGRFTQLPSGAGGLATGGLRVVRPSDSRVALMIRNASAVDSYYSERQEVSSRNQILGPGESLSFLYPTTPMNALYFVHGDGSGGDLRVAEIVYERPGDWLSDLETGDIE